MSLQDVRDCNFLTTIMIMIIDIILPTIQDIYMKRVNA
jgi:hypothetical protein